MTETVYKVAVVDKNTGKYVSVCSLWKENGYDIHEIALEYAIDKITKPEIKNSKILAFDSMRRAEIFASANCRAADFVILECECNEKMYISHVAGLCQGFVDYFWQPGDKQKMEWYFEIKAPDGTMGCDWLRPVTVLYDSRWPLSKKLKGV